MNSGSRSKDAEEQGHDGLDILDHDRIFNPTLTSDGISPYLPLLHASTV
jgi:hypothetical protein